MIYTVTINPSIDYVMYIENFSIGNITRSDRVVYHCGGKGINVSTILNEFGITSCALGFTAGTVGKAIEDLLSSKGVPTDFVRLENGESRINVKIRSELETDINASGPDISESDVDRLIKKLHNAKSGDFIVLSGSVPKNLGDDIYGRIMNEFKGTDIRFVVDAQGDLLSNAIKYKPFLIKPNEDELAGLFGKYAESEKELVSQAKELQILGAENVLISRGSKGSLLLTYDGRVYTAKGASGKIIDTVGAGDSMVAGFIAGYLLDESFETAIEMGSAAGGATALSEGLATKEEILSMRAYVKPIRLRF